ncbi:unnamed protein product [Staurois parvus]|uniref:Uncharacterized protein n=1 Tax=Staurois parvus TaxID=386267 RepID=A0ABN9B0H9_9NEOB|nr:unnamed protein product [Staurois parvus]
MCGFISLMKSTGNPLSFLRKRRRNRPVQTPSVPIPSISCDSGVPIPSMDTGVYNQAPRHADGFYKHW